MTTVHDIASHLKKTYPPDLAAEWDNVGLLLGDAGRRVARLMTCLTVTEAVVTEAVSRGADLIVSHHPILFRGAKRLSSESRDGRLLMPLLANGVAVYSPHTAFDNAPGGINDMLAERLGLRDLAPLRKRGGTAQFKVVVFVPDDDLRAVCDAMFSAGAGRIGEYTECSFRVAGTGSFRGSDSSNPTVGEKGRREEVAEWRVEVVCPGAAVERVLRAMREAHSYEEPACDVHPLWAAPGGGEGRVGVLAQPTSLERFARKVKSATRAVRLQTVGDAEREVRRVAVACGAAGEFLTDAARARADVFVTGEMRFHDFYEADARGVAVVVAGHYPTERFAVEELARTLAGVFPDAEVWASENDAEPSRWL